MIDELRMAELLCTRLCHDLTGPIGAVNNGAEFLSEEGFNMQGQAMELIISSAFSAVARLQFYRMAYGKVKEHGEANLAEKQKIAGDFFAGSKITLDWPDSHSEAAAVSISLKMSRLLYNLLIIASSALIRGDTIAIRLSPAASGGKQMVVSASGAGLKLEPDMEKICSGKMLPDDLTPKNVQMYFTKRLADEIKSELTYRVENETLELQVVQP